MLFRSQPLIIKTMEENQEQLSESYKADILGLEDPVYIDVNKTAEDSLKARIFYELVEIHDTFERIKECKHYISVFPFKSNKISKSGYLNLINESYFHEIYILRERLKTFLPNIIKNHKGTKYYKDGKKIADKLHKSIMVTFKNASDIRNNHVHRGRLEVKSIKRLSSLELLQLSDNKDFVTETKNIYKVQFLETRKLLKSNYTNTIKEIEKALDYYFWAVESFLYQDNLVVLPNQKEK